MTAKPGILAIATILFAAAALPPMAEAGIIERACKQSNRPGATGQLCGCIQKVANRSLSMGERRRVAKWFRDPHQAQVVRQSDRRRDEILWERYKAFGERARQTCG